MCGHHEMSYHEPLPPELLEQLAEIAIPIRCLPALNVHEHCEHVRPVPSFREMPTLAQLGVVTS